MTRPGRARGRSGPTGSWIRGTAAVLSTLLLVLLMTGARPASTQDGEASADETRVEEAQSEAPGAPPSASDPLPSPSMQRAYWHVFTAFGIAWVLLLGYAVLLNRRVAQAERDLARLAGRGE